MERGGFFVRSYLGEEERERVATTIKQKSVKEDRAVKIPRSLLLGRGEHDLKSSYEPLHASVKKRKERVATCVVLLCGNTC